MREAIEKVIAELRVKKMKLRPNVSQHMRVGEAYYDMGARDAYGEAIDKLKAVIAEDEPNLKSEQHAPES